MAGEPAAKHDRSKKEKASRVPHPPGKKAKTLADEELGPERREELAQQIEAKQFRGKPPSI